MRFLILDTCYSKFLDAHYARHPALVDAPYDVQWRALMDQCFGTSDAYSHFLRELGHDAHELVVNCEPLQQAWVREHEVGLRTRLRSLRDGAVVLAQVEDYRPDVIYVQDLSALKPRQLRLLRARSRILVGQLGTEAPQSEWLDQFDLLLTSFPHFVSWLRNHGIASEYFRIGFDPRVLTRLEGETPSLGAVFVGGVGSSPRWSSNLLLERAAERVHIDFWGYEVGRLPAGSAIERRYHGEAWGLDMYRVLARSRIAINRHGDVAGDHANNMRLYEATGVGTLLLTDAKRNFADLFEPGKEVITYSSEDELVKMIRRYLANEDERLEIARAGQARTLSEHTYARRMEELVEILGRYLA